MLRKIFSLILIIASFFAEVLSLFYLYVYYPNYTPISMIIIVVIHILAAYIASWGAFLYKKEVSRLFPFVFTIILTLPLAGYLIILLMLGSELEKGESLLYTEYQQHIHSGATEIEYREKLKRDEVIRQNIQVEPLVEAVEEEGSLDKKLGLIRKLGALSGPVSLEVLRGLLVHSHMDIRYYAGEQFAQIAETYNVFINNMQQEIAKNPDDPKIYLEIGKLYMEYAFSGLFDENDLKDELLNAEKAFRKSVELDPEQFKPNFLLGELCYYRGDYREAMKFYMKVQEIIPGDFRSNLGLAKCCWHLKEPAKLNRYVKKLKENLEQYKGEDRDEVADFIEVYG